MHQKTFDEPLKMFSDNLLHLTLIYYLLTYLQMFMMLNIFTGLGNILCQRKDFQSIKPAAIVF